MQNSIVGPFLYYILRVGTLIRVYIHSCLYIHTFLVHLY